MAEACTTRTAALTASSIAPAAKWSKSPVGTALASRRIPSSTSWPSLVPGGGGGLGAAGGGGGGGGGDGLGGGGGGGGLDCSTHSPSNCGGLLGELRSHRPEQHSLGMKQFWPIVKQGGGGGGGGGGRGGGRGGGGGLGGGGAGRGDGGGDGGGLDASGSVLLAQHV